MNLYDIVNPMTMAEAKTDYEKRRQRERDIDTGKPVAKQRQPRMTDYQKKRAQDKKDMALGEDAWHAGDNAWSSDNHEMVEGQLNVGDPVVVTAPNEFRGKTGEIAEFSPSGKFVVVNLYNHGQHSMHLSDVEYNQYAANQDDVEGWEDDYHDEYYADLKEVGVDEGFQDFNKVEPYAVCLAGKPVKRFDYYEQARRFHDNWKQKLYREGNKAKADTITLMPLNLDEAMNVNDLLNKVTKDSNKNFKKAKAGKLKASGDFTKGDHWTGPDKDDPSYTKNFGHGYPDTPSNRSHDRYVKKSLKKGVAEETREAELNRKFNSPEQLKKDADYRAYRAGVKASRKQPPTPLPVKEDWIDDNAAEPLARYFADLYYGDFSATEKVKLTAYIYQSIQDGKLSIDQLKADIDMLEKEKGIKEQGVAEMDSRGHTGTRDDYEKDRKHKGPVGTGTPVPVKDFVKGVLKDLKKVNVKEQGVAEAQLDEATSREILLGLLDKFYADMKLPPRQGSHSGALDIKSPGTKVWTRGDGTRLRDPGHVKANRWADDKKQAEKAATNFWPWLLKQPGVKSIGQVSGQFGSSPMTDAVSYKGLYFSGGPYGTEFGSMSRVKNPKSVWRHKPFELEPKDEQGVAEGDVIPFKRPESKIKPEVRRVFIRHLLDQGYTNDEISRMNDEQFTKAYYGIKGKTKVKDVRPNWTDDLPDELDEQGVAEEVSRLSDEEYNRVAAYVRKKYPGTQLSGLGRNPDGSFNVMIDSGSGRHEFKVRFRDPEETDIGEGWKAPVAALATVGALAGGVAMNPDLEINGQRYQKTSQHALSNAPADAKTVTKDGKTYKVWTINRPGGRHGGPVNVYAEIPVVKESYWTKLQNERNTKINTLVNELKESVKK